MATTTLREAVIALLQADATLVATLTGGIQNRRGISRTDLPAAYNDRGELKPTAVVTIEATSPVGPAQFDFEQRFFQVWIYEQAGNNYAGIDVAKERIRALLHRQTVSIEPGCVHEIRHADSLGDSFDETLDAEMTYERFYAWTKRST